MSSPFDPGDELRRLYADPRLSFDQREWLPRDLFERGRFDDDDDDDGLAVPARLGPSAPLGRSGAAAVPESFRAGWSDSE